MADSIPMKPDWPTFVDGKEYTYAQIARYTWGPRQGDRPRDPDARFTYRSGRNGHLGTFEEIVAETPFSLVPAAEAHDAVQKLLRRGLTLRDIAKQSGVSLATAERAAAGHGYMRRATRDALGRAASNGHR